MRAVTDVRFASSRGKARCPWSQPCPSPQAPLPAPRSTQAAPPGAPAYLAAGCQRSGGASSPSPPGLLPGWERHVPRVHGRTLGNYYGLGARGAGGRWEGRGGGADPKLSTLHPSLPQLLSMPSCPASPLGGLSVSTRSYSGFSWQPAGGRREQLRGVGVERCRGEGRGSVYSPRSPGGRKPPFAHPIALSSALPGAGSFCTPPTPHTLVLQKCCAGPMQGELCLRGQLRVGGGGAERQIFPLSIA